MQYDYNPKLCFGRGRQIHNAFPDDYVVLDIETTGLNEKSCEIIEIAALRVSDNQEYLDSIFQVSMNVNRDLYAELKRRKPDMCQAFKELFKEEIQEEIDKATADKDAKLAEKDAELANSRAESAKNAMDINALREQLRAAGLVPVV